MGHFTLRTQSISTKNVEKLSLHYYFYITPCVKIALHFLRKLQEICITLRVLFPFTYHHTFIRITDLISGHLTYIKIHNTGKCTR